MSEEEHRKDKGGDPIYVKESTNCSSMLHIFNDRRLVGLGVWFSGI